MAGKLSVKLSPHKIKAKLALEGIDPALTYDVSVTVTAAGAGIAAKSASVSPGTPDFEEKQADEKFEVELEQNGELEIAYKHQGIDGTVQHDVTITIFQGRTSVLSESLSVSPENPKVKKTL